MSFLIDTYGEPSAAELHMAGCVGCTRYISHSRGKCLTSGQVSRIHARGKRIVPNFEDSATNARGGHDQGVRDAQFSVGMLKSLAAPKGVACYASADYEIHSGHSYWATTLDYFRGYSATMHAAGYLSGCYGNYDLTSALLDAKIVDFAWQCEAWSYGAKDPRAVMIQDKYAGSWDRDSIQHDYMGAWLPTGAQPAPTTKDEFDMANLADLQKIVDARADQTDAKLLAALPGLVADAVYKATRDWQKGDDGNRHPTEAIVNHVVHNIPYPKVKK